MTTYTTLPQDDSNLEVTITDPNNYVSTPQDDQSLEVIITEGDDQVVLNITPAAVNITSAVTSVNGEVGNVTLDTDDIGEGVTNLYYTDPRVDAYLRSGDVDLVNFTDGSATVDWNADDATLNINYQNGVSLQVGQEEHFYAKATEAISDGDICQFAGAQGGHLLISKADMNSAGFEPEYVVGIATQNFAINEFGYVTTFGKVRGLDTAAFTEGAIIYLDPTTPGAWTTTRPTPAQGHSIQVAAVTRSHSQVGTVAVRVTHMPDTDETPEGSTNLYYTDARADARVDLQTGANLDLSFADTNDLAEGPDNLYYTDARVQTVIDTNTAGFITATSTDTLTNKSGNISQWTNDAGYLTSETDSQTLSFTTPNLTISNGNTVDLSTINNIISVNGLTGVVVLDTDNITEGSTNLYYTDARADARVNLQTGTNLDLSQKTTTDLVEGTNLYLSTTNIEALDYDSDGGTY